MIFIILLLGFVFGGLLLYAKLNRFDTISGLAILKDLTVAKAILLAVGLGAILVNIEIGMGAASFHVKPFIAVGIILGGIIFGIGMAILGYCPGTLAVSLGEGSLDALSGIIGGLAGGIIFTLILPAAGSVLGPDLGKLSLNSLLGENNFVYYLIVFVFGAALIFASLYIQKKEKSINFKWFASGIGLAVLEVITFSSSVTNRPVGASTTYPYAGDSIFGITSGEYFSKISTPGNWELIFLTGAFLAGLVFSLVRKDFRLSIIHKNWEKYRGISNLNRLGWSFAGGFILIFGARMAGGCTSGHILSGGMQIAFSSLVFGVFAFIGLLVTGKFFYNVKEK